MEKLLHFVRVLIWAQILLLLDSCTLYAQENNTTWYHWNVSPGAKTVDVRRYQPVLKDGVYQKGRHSKEHETYHLYKHDYMLYFSTDGLLLKNQYIYRGKLSDSYSTYKYNEKRQLIRETWVPDSELPISCQSFEYDEQCRLSMWVSETDIYARLPVRYEGDVRVSYNGDRRRFNSHGQIIEYFPSQIDDSRNYYSYSPDGLLTKYVWEKDVFGKKSETEPLYVYKKVYSYEYTGYNAHGDWNKALIRFDGKPVMIVERKITYEEEAPNEPVRLGRKIVFSPDGPVTVYDSIPSNMNPDLVSPNDIKSIDVIKDRNEAIKRFGPNGKNGAIIITLKKKLHGK